MKIAAMVMMVMLGTTDALAAPATCSVNVGKDPVVMRMAKDEFRIAFGVSGDECHENGCSGVIHYDAAWRTEDGAENVDHKVLSYNIPSGTKESIAVDRHYFDTGEGKHTTDLVRVSVGDISCQPARLTVGR
ncbi:MAG: hypothetical protein ACREPX_07175 [Rhodanobacteraceae bacterium]